MPPKKPQFAGPISIVEGPPSRRIFAPVNPVRAPIDARVGNRPLGLNPTLNQAPVAPIFDLTSDAVVPPGQSASPNIGSLRGPPGVGILIDEIRITVSHLPIDNPQDIVSVEQVFGAGCGGMLVNASFKLGSEPLTAGFVPVALLGPCAVTTAENAGLQAGRTAHYVWTPKEPIYVPPGESLSPTFENAGFLNLNARVVVSYTARPADRAPEKRRLPYVISWRSPMFIPNGTEVEYASTEKDLVNKLGVPFDVECMVGRVLSLVQTGLNPPIRVMEGNYTQGAGVAYDSTSGSDNAFVASPLDSTKVQITASWGTHTAITWPAWAAVFDLFTRSVPCPHTVDPEGYYITQVRGGGTVIQGSQYFVGLSVVGSREVAS